MLFVMVFVLQKRLWKKSPYSRIDIRMYLCQYIGMNKAKRITANLPADLLKEATKVTKQGITETLIQGLRLIKRSAAYQKAEALKGKLNIDIDLSVSRERSHR